MPVTEEQIRTLALAMPGAFEQSSYGGRPSWRTKARMFAWLREDPEALVVWVDGEEEKLAMINSEPRKFFTTDHYNGSPIVLVRLGRVGATETRELLIESWRQRSTKTAVRDWDAKQLQR